MEEMQTHWETKYKSKNFHEETPMISLQLIKELNGDNIIDIGAGTSTLVDTLLQQGKKIAVLDISQESITINQQRLGDKLSKQVEWILTDITSQPTPHTFDIWHDRAVFHLFWNQQDQINYKTNALASIKLGGYLLIGTFSMDAPTECCGLPIHRYSEESLTAFFVPEFEKVYTKSFEGVNGSAPFVFGLFRKYK